MHVSLLVCDRIMNESDTYTNHSLSDECTRFAAHVPGRLQLCGSLGSGSLNLISCVLVATSMA